MPYAPHPTWSPLFSGQVGCHRPRLFLPTGGVPDGRAGRTVPCRLYCTAAPAQSIVFFRMKVDDMTTAMSRMW